MGTVRNNINIEGLSLEEELPKKNNGQLITYSETNYLHIPDSNKEAKDIYEVSIEIDIVSKRVVNTGIGKIIILDGLKKYKILYIENNDASSASILYLEAPYNTFIELPQSTGTISEINIHILDAYYHLTNSRTIYEHLVYQLDLHYDKKMIINNKVNLSEKRLLDESLIERLKSVNNVLSEAAFSINNSEDDQDNDNIMIAYRNVDEVFM